MNPLKWRLMGEGPKVDLLKEVVPEQFQPVATAFERAAAEGITVTQVAPMYQAGSGLTRAALRGGDFRPSFSSATSSTASCPHSVRATGRSCTPTTATWT